MFGASIQAGTIHGDIHLISTVERAGVPIPRQLAAPSALFTNRAAELRRMDTLLPAPAATTPRVIVLRGPGGIGKTALALQWLHSIAHRFPDGQLYLDLSALDRGIGDNGPNATAEAVAQCLRSLGVHPAHVPGELAEQVGLFRSVTAGKAIAVLVDNAVSAAQVRTLLPASAHCVVVVSSRRSLRGLLADGAAFVDVAPLEHAAALELLTKVLGADRVSAEAEPARRLVGLCDGLPLALCVASGQLAYRPQQSLTHAVDVLADERGRLAVMAEDEDVSVQATFDSSYQVLPDHAARAYRLMGLHPGPHFGLPVVAAALGTDLSQARRSIEVLVDSSLLSEIATGRFQFHDLLRVHAATTARRVDDPTHLQGCLLAMAEWYLHAARAAYRVLVPARRQLDYSYRTHAPDVAVPDQAGDSATALEFLEQERLCLVGCIAWAVDNRHGELAWQTADALWPVYLLHKHYTEWWDVDRLAWAAARLWGRPSAEISSLKRWSRACVELGRVDEARAHIQRALDLAEAIGDQRRVASMRKAMGTLLLDIDQPGQAIDWLTQALPTYRGLGKYRSAALTQLNLGVALTLTGRAGEAVALLDEAVAAFAALPHPDDYNGARSLIARGRALVRVGQRARARGDLQAAMAVMTRLGSAYEQAQVRIGLAELAESNGDPRTAQDEYEQALELLTATGSSPKASAVRSRIEALRRQG
ncbi:tetratricopeptide repeat protein [Kutzneria sp. NPDC052558]|uniref:tetratricopeptide repeat protein n=1 Tax=Kutzneria sp. NPDC052558 TaxID=3364121 RepID=UPI0037C5CB84